MSSARARLMSAFAAAIADQQRTAIDLASAFDAARWTAARHGDTATDGMTVAAVTGAGAIAGGGATLPPLAMNATSCSR